MTVEEFDAKLKEMLQELADKGILIERISPSYLHTMESSHVSHTSIDVLMR